MKYSLPISSNRYDFEIEVLLKAEKHNIKIKEVPIKIIYIDNNKESHFNPFFDSLKIYFILCRFLLSSMFSYTLDYALFFVLISFSSLSTSFSFILARIFGAFVNYNLNKKIVFKSNTSSRYQPLKYFLLLCINLLIGFFLIKEISFYITNLNISKILVDLFLLAFNFLAQKEWIFKKEEDEETS